ncbi:MAG: hypothetical protein MJ222_02920 [Bacilli bacterium]|nr:hypothetical protein [Bacilli bacterium]
MMSTFLIIMGIVTLIIALAAAIGQIVKISDAFSEYASGWEKCGTILNLLAILTLGAGIGTLFFVVSGLL